jgi:hypothetical protein
MTTKTMDEILKSVLNDSDIFFMYFTIFDNSEWKDLREKYSQKDFTYITSKFDQKLKALKREFNSQRSRKERLKEAITCTKALKNAVHDKPYILERLLTTLDKFGMVTCNLPNMEGYGRVIENRSPATVEQFFLYNIRKARSYEKSALLKVLEYVKELYALNYGILEIAFFVRKLNSLEEFFKMIKY